MMDELKLELKSKQSRKSKGNLMHYFIDNWFL